MGAVSLFDEGHRFVVGCNYVEREKEREIMFVHVNVLNSVWKLHYNFKTFGIVFIFLLFARVATAIFVTTCEIYQHFFCQQILGNI